MRYEIDWQEAGKLAASYSLAKLYTFRARFTKAGKFEKVALVDAAIERKLCSIYGEAQA